MKPKKQMTKNKLYCTTIYYSVVPVKIFLMKCSNYKKSNVWKICQHIWDKKINEEKCECVGIPPCVNYLKDDVINKTKNDLSQINDKYVAIIKVEDFESTIWCFTYDEL